MRIRIIQRPTVKFIDGVHLDQFRPNHVYQVGRLMAGVFLAEGWAEPVEDQESGRQDAPAIPPNLTREFFPPYYDGSPSALAAEQASRRRARRRRK